MSKIALEALGGARLNIERSGNGPPILAVHGFTGNSSTWASFSEAARPDYSVLAVDMLGHGFSDSPESVEPYSMENTIKVLDGLLDKLNIERVHWLGYSMGGRIALAAAILLSERTLSVTLESASPGLAAPDERAARIRSDEALADKIKAEGIGPFIGYWESLPMWASQVRLSEAVRRKMRLQRLSNNPVGLANSLRGIGTGAQPSFHRRLRELRVPALLIAGEEDRKFADIAQEMHSVVVGSQLHIVKESGHTVHLEQPALFNRIVLEFLRNVEVQATREARARSQQSL